MYELLWSLSSPGVTLLAAVAVVLPYLNELLVYGEMLSPEVKFSPSTLMDYRYVSGVNTNSLLTAKARSTATVSLDFHCRPPKSGNCYS